MNRKFFKFLSFFIASLLAVLGFTACNDDDVQPEYGVPVSRNIADLNMSLPNDNQINYDVKTN